MSNKIMTFFTGMIDFVSWSGADQKLESWERNLLTNLEYRESIRVISPMKSSAVDSSRKPNQYPTSKRKLKRITRQVYSTWVSVQIVKHFEKFKDLCVRQILGVINQGNLFIRIVVLIRSPKKKWTAIK